MGNSRGFGLIETVVAAAVLGAMLLGMTSMFQTMVQMQNYMSAGQDRATYEAAIQAAIATSADECMDAIGSLNQDFNIDKAEKSRERGLPLDIRLKNGERLRDGFVIPNTKIKIDWIRFSNAVPESAGTFTGSVWVQFALKDGVETVGPRSFQAKEYPQIKVTVTGGKISSCTAGTSSVPNLVLCTKKVLSGFGAYPGSGGGGCKSPAKEVSCAIASRQSDTGSSGGKDGNGGGGRVTTTTTLICACATDDGSKAGCERTYY